MYPKFCNNKRKIWQNKISHFMFFSIHVLLITAGHLKFILRPFTYSRPPGWEALPYIKCIHIALANLNCSTSIIFVLFVPGKFPAAPTPHPIFVSSSPHRASYCCINVNCFFLSGCSEAKGDKSPAKPCPKCYVPFIGQSLCDLWPLHSHCEPLGRLKVRCCDHMWMIHVDLWSYKVLISLAPNTTLSYKWIIFEGLSIFIRNEITKERYICKCHYLFTAENKTMGCVGIGSNKSAPFDVNQYFSWKVCKNRQQWTLKVEFDILANLHLWFGPENELSGL